MRLATVATGAGPRAGVVHDGGFVPVGHYQDVGALLRDPAGIEAASAADRDRASEPLDALQILRPVLAPGAVVCVGLNYRTHILEMGRELPTHPTLFSKLTRAMTDPYAPVTLPSVSSQIDYEAELAVVIGTGGRNISPEHALEHVAGLSALNDVTARDYQRRTVQWFAGKTFEASTPWGPWIVTLDELGDLAGLSLSLSVNGEERQRALLGDLVFGVADLVADLSTIITLQPGDVIATGTPGGVGAASGRFLGAGDEVTVAIDGIGQITNSFQVERA